MVDTRSGCEIDTSCAVFVEYLQDDRGNFRLAMLGKDDWGDRAVVVDAKVCDEDDDCRILTVAPDGSETLEHVHVDDTTRYAVDIN